MNTSHLKARIESHAFGAHCEIRLAASTAAQEIAGKANFYIRSIGQVARWRKFNEKKGNEK